MYNKGVNPCLIGFDWNIVDTSIYIKPSGKLKRVVVEITKRKHVKRSLVSQSIGM